MSFMQNTFKMLAVLNFSQQVFFFNFFDKFVCNKWL